MNEGGELIPIEFTLEPAHLLEDVRRQRFFLRFNLIQKNFVEGELHIVEKIADRLHLSSEVVVEKDEGGILSGRNLNVHHCYFIIMIFYQEKIIIKLKLTGGASRKFPSEINIILSKKCFSSGEHCSRCCSCSYPPPWRSAVKLITFCWFPCGGQIHLWNEFPKLIPIFSESCWGCSSGFRWRERYTK